MSRFCPVCKAPVAPRPEGNPKGVAYALEDGTPIMLLVLYECRCGSHQSCVIWQDEECTAAELEEEAAEAEAAKLYRLEEAPIDRACERTFFSLTHELAARGL